MQIKTKINRENKVKNITRRQTGITLIVLVVTIIILLILAGVSIAMLTGNNGILTQSKAAKENTQIAKEQEEKDLEKMNSYINEKTIKDNYTDINGDKATIPTGFIVSKIEEEQTIANGLVIYDIPEIEIQNVDWTTKNADGTYNVQTLYNQFVWIPVASENAYQRNFSYPSYYYENDLWTSSEMTPENSTFTDIGYLPIGIQSITDDTTNNEITERNAVLKYNGFYIARYEAGKENLNVVSKKNATVYVDETQENLKSIGKTMYGESSTYVKSAMCSGIQWDMVMKFVNGKKCGNNEIYDVRINNENRHKGESIRVEKSGNNIADKVQNIYELEGNCSEYVAEKNNTKYIYILRGGDYSYNSICRASVRGGTNGSAKGNATFRPVLYIE